MTISHIIFYVFGVGLKMGFLHSRYIMLLLYKVFNGGSFFWQLNGYMDIFSCFLYLSLQVTVYMLVVSDPFCDSCSFLNLEDIYGC